MHRSLSHLIKKIFFLIAIYFFSHVNSEKKINCASRNNNAINLHHYFLYLSSAINLLDDMTMQL